MDGGCYVNAGIVAWVALAALVIAIVALVLVLTP